MCQERRTKMLSFLLIQVLSLCTLSQSQDQYLPFLITLGTTTGATRHYLPEVDDGASGSISIPGGFYFGRTSKTAVYVSTNGYFAFGTERTRCCPVTFSSTSLPENIVAPFWADIDTVLGGSISYEVHSTSSGFYSELLDQVSTFISSQQNTQFIGNWMLLASWEQVRKYDGSSSTNTFQGILITDGISSYTVFTYECGAIGWGGGATIGYKGTGSFYQNHALSGAGAASIDCVNSPASQWSNVVYGLNIGEAVCSSPCQHGGQCVALNSCSCIPGWTGQLCETAVCSTLCNHGGECVAPNTCSCTSDWIGPICETAVCNPLCGNGGTCTAPGICSCTSEWTGEYCQTDLADLDSPQQKQLVIVIGSIIGGVALTTFIWFVILLTCCCTASCPMHRAYYGGATPSSSDSHSRTRGAYVVLQNSSDTQELELPPPPSPPPSYSELGETTQPQNA